MSVRNRWYTPIYAGTPEFDAHAYYGVISPRVIEYARTHQSLYERMRAQSVAHVLSENHTQSR